MKFDDSLRLYRSATASLLKESSLFYALLVVQPLNSFGCGILWLEIAAHLSGAGNDNITVPPPLWVEVGRKAHFRSQPPTSRCLEQIPFGKLDLRARGDHDAVVLKPHRVIFACVDLSDVRPAADIALPGAVISHGDHGAVGLKAHCVLLACGDHGGAFGLGLTEDPSNEPFYPVHLAGKSKVYKSIVFSLLKHERFPLDTNPLSTGKYSFTVKTLEVNKKDYETKLVFNITLNNEQINNLSTGSYLIPFLDEVKDKREKLHN